MQLDEKRGCAPSLLLKNVTFNSILPIEVYG